MSSGGSVDLLYCMYIWTHFEVCDAHCIHKDVNEWLLGT